MLALHTFHYLLESLPRHDSRADEGAGGQMTIIIIWLLASFVITCFIGKLIHCGSQEE